MGLKSHLSEGHLMRLRADYHLAEHDQFQALDELLTGDVLAQEAKAPASNAGTISFGGVRCGKDDRSNRKGFAATTRRTKSLVVEAYSLTPKTQMQMPAEPR